MVRQDKSKAIRLCSRIDWWLVAHLTDILYKSGNLNDLRFDVSHVWEYFLASYAEILIPHRTLWHVGLDYLAACPNIGKSAIEEYIMHIPIENEMKARKVLEFCAQYCSEHVFNTINRILASRKLKQGQYAAAIAYYINAGEPKRVITISDILIDEYLKNGDMSCMDLIDGIGYDAVFSDRLVFLADYRSFHELYKAGKYMEAGKLLRKLLESEYAPKKFWPVLLVDAIPLLEGEEIVFDVDDTYELMRCLEEVTLSHQKDYYLQFLPSSTSSEKDITVNERERQLDIVRLALSRNLARAMIVFSNGFDM
ncbi:Nucleoporin nup85 [Basidiobolus ranarum]|uniref:Nuclear pore complex protein Nup85 n=1 Tax=Basidiobolus ranarum TaxID=34480 RepID=A0ABR2VVG9_9FUNG